MKVMIHACPERMWYVEQFLVPSLEGAEIRIWNDTEHRGNLRSCMDAFAACEGEGDTWHIQDDVLLCRDFLRKAGAFPAGVVVYGFCCEYFLDDPEIFGEVYMPDVWHSFQCVRIPDAWARECAEWYATRRWEWESMDLALPALEATNRGDDAFFREFLQCRHGEATAINARPNLAEHVDLLIGGSVLHQYRDYQARAYWWEDEDLVAALRYELRERRLGSWAVT
jgi:hypothetical protein